MWKSVSVTETSLQWKVSVSRIFWSRVLTDLLDLLDLLDMLDMLDLLGLFFFLFCTLTAVLED